MKEKQVAVEEKTLTDDELYAKIQTEKLLKKKKTRRIVTSVVLGVAFALAVCVIILAAVPVSLKPRCLKAQYDEVRMYEGTKAVASFTKDDARFEQFGKAFNKSFSKTYLTALFSGSLFSYDIDELYNSNTDLSSVVSLVGNDSHLVRLSYTTDQTLVTQNGKTFVSDYSNSKWNGKLTFKDVYVVINSEKGLTTTNIFVVATYPTFNQSEQTGSEKRLVRLTVKADTNVLFGQWDDIVAKN